MDYSFPVIPSALYWRHDLQNVIFSQVFNEALKKLKYHLEDLIKLRNHNFMNPEHGCFSSHDIFWITATSKQDWQIKLIPYEDLNPETELRALILVKKYIETEFMDKITNIYIDRLYSNSIQIKKNIAIHWK